LALAAELLDDGLQVEHEVHIRADELAHLVHREDETELATVLCFLRVDVGFNLVGE